jgi:hypothetical protein
MAKKKISPEISAAAAALGSSGGHARAKALTAKRRREIGRAAIAARWANRAEAEKRPAK